MSSRRLLSSGLFSQVSRRVVASSNLPVSTQSVFITRSFTSKDGDDENEKKNYDPFGVNYDDGNDQLGKDLPPNYVRDKATGKLTGEVVQELTPEEEKLMNMDEFEKEAVVMDRLHEEWEKEDQDGKLSDELAERIAEEEMALNTIGRSPSVQSVRGVRESGEDAFTDETGFSQPLTPGEFDSFSEFMKKEFDSKLSISDGAIPTLDTGLDYHEDDNPDLDLAWMSAASRRKMDGEEVIEDPLADLTPHDMNPTRLVNRRMAKPIPTELLHHNNLVLLRRYITPTGQIMNRTQSRLGAKDQRKVAKLIKRARAMGLIPHVGQWKYENNGNIHDADIHEEREWEQELMRRGLKVNHDKKSHQDE
mmetsp:Transcript_8148/g.12490  ORF Transcript_8148/g.12490 Transcript_8148/m.12490 type:complete len:363 (+) Transcript_8148:131-1219(+)